MIPVVLVPGTFGGEAGWFTEGSPFWAFLESQGFAPITFRGWDGDVDGLFNPLENGRRASWRAGGWALAYLLEKYPAPVIAHSHGGQVAAYCAGLAGTTIPALVTVCTPVRSDMREWYAAARPRIGHWRHAYSLSFDFWQRAGELLDGHVGWTREIKEAHDNIGIPKIGHTGLVDTPANFHWWSDAGLLDVLKMPARVAEGA